MRPALFPGDRMPEILTESFCERCGTRYTFESAAPKAARLKGFKVMSRGLRNFVMSDDTSMDEAMAAARNESDREATSQQLDAFHKTFNFCMSCRQYTCGNCWNDAEGRCLSCAPNLGHDILPAPFPNLDPGNGLPLGATSLPTELHNGHDAADAATIEPMAWPTSDLMREEEAAATTFDDVVAQHAAQVPAEEDEAFDPLARLAALDASAPAVPEPASVEPATMAPAEDVAAVDEPMPSWGLIGVEDEAPAAAEEPVVTEQPAAEEPVAFATAEPVEVDAEPGPVAADAPPAPAPAPVGEDRAAAAAAQTRDLFDRFRPGQNLDDAIAAYERAQAAADALADQAPSPEPVAAAAEPVAAPPEPGPVAPVGEPEVVAEPPAPEPVAQAPATAPVPEPAWSSIERETAPEPIAAAPEAPDAEPQPGPATLEPLAPSPADLDRIAAWGAPREPEPRPEPATAEPVVPEPVAAEPRIDVVPQPTWQIMAPDTNEEPQWPAPPAWPGAQPSDGLAFLGRPAQPTGGMDALWAESAREVASTAEAPAAGGVAPLVKPAGGVQPCVSCGLSLSANARFCRRCGTRQG